MVKRRGPPSQGWRTFLCNHAPDIAAMDLFVVPTIGFDLLYAFVIVRLDRRDLVWINVTTNPTADWIARQLTEAFPWDEGPRYLIRDRDRIYGTVVTRRLRAMGIRDKPTASASPGQNGYAERLIGSIRRECVDHIIVLGEAHLRRILRSYAITMKLEHIGHWIKMRQSLARFSASVSSVHAPSWADFIIATPAFKLSVHTREEVLTWSEEKPTTAKPNHPLAHSTAWWISQRLGNSEASIRPGQAPSKTAPTRGRRCGAELSEVSSIGDLDGLLEQVGSQ